jgi:hypothetical protein
VTKSGFSAKLYQGLTVTVNRVVTFDIVLDVGAVQETVTVRASGPQLDSGISSSGATILPQQIEQMPLNGRNYLDLMQLVPGIMVNRRVDDGLDGAVPILGERGGNAAFLIDGMPNSNFVDGGPASPFNQDSILEFQVLTAGYNAEFGHGSGGIINVLTKSGNAEWHGLVSAFHRNDALDSSDIAGTSAPFLRRWDLSGNLGGTVIKDRVFLFGSLERVRESRQLNFSFPPGIPDFLQARENTFDEHSQTFQTRSFLKLDGQAGRHRLTGQMNLTNGHVTDFLPLSQATSLPSTRTSADSRALMLGFHDTATLGDRGNPFLLSAYVQYRGEPLAKRAAHPEASPATTLFNIFSGLSTGRVTGDLGQVRFGAGFTPLALNQKYASTGAHLDRVLGSHGIKFGWDFERTRVDGAEANNVLNQLFATVSDFGQFGPVTSGVYTLRTVGGATAADNLVHLRNNYNAGFVQDDWRIAKTVTLNLGLRWDHDSRFPNRANFSPRLGLAWSPTPKTVISASWGIFYDHFRLGLARDIPTLGGANISRNQNISFPRLFYGDPTTFPRSNGICHSPTLSDSEIAAAATCPVAGLPFFGVDHLNAIRAPGHAAIPANAVVSLDNVQTLTGLTPQQYADAASLAIGRDPGFFSSGGFGHLTMNFAAAQTFLIPITVKSGFGTPFTTEFSYRRATGGYRQHRHSGGLSASGDTEHPRCQDLQPRL